MNDGSLEFQEELKLLKGVLVGMGSFYDLPLYPVQGARTTPGAVDTWSKTTPVQ